jgi:hypothetical protein
MSMNYTLAVTGAGFAALTVLAVLARNQRGTLTPTVGAWLFVAAGLVALVGALYLIQRAYPAEPAVYTTLRVVLAVALVGTFARIVLLSR